jgi:hypothetical protein
MKLKKPTVNCCNSNVNLLPSYEVGISMTNQGNPGEVYYFTAKTEKRLFHVRRLTYFPPPFARNAGIRKPSRGSIPNIVETAVNTANIMVHVSFWV